MHADLVFSIALKYLSSEAAAKDALQEVFVKIWKSAHLYAPDLGKVVSWVTTMSRNHCLNLLRSEQRRNSAHRISGEDLSQERTAPPLPLAGLIAQERAAAVQASLNLLPAEQSAAINLAFFENMTHEAAAAALQVPLGTLKARIRRGLLKLQEELQSLH
jgi:RNA polymerase sigma-70 factor, ECF subfamily